MRCPTRRCKGCDAGRSVGRSVGWSIGGRSIGGLISLVDFIGLFRFVRISIFRCHDSLAALTIIMYYLSDWVLHLCRVILCYVVGLFEVAGSSS